MQKSARQLSSRGPDSRLIGGGGEWLIDWLGDWSRDYIVLVLTFNCFHPAGTDDRFALTSPYDLGFDGPSLLFLQLQLLSIPS